ncbi:MAG: 3-keto-disaccharide hydrolase [Verrucomicrobiales bacterium]
MKAVLVCLFCSAAIAAAKDPAEIEWQPLLKNPNSFQGFRQLGGKAYYEVQDGVVTGTSVLKEPNSFMATEKEYGDFVLEYEFKVDDQLNSGVQIRSHSRPDNHNGRVHGYQIEIDPSARAWSGGLYDEGRRGWLDDLKDNPKAGAAFKHGDWNKVRVEAIGDSIKTWINDVAAADLRDAMDQTGFIALQVHGVGSDAKKVGTQVQWRNLRIKDLGRHDWQPLFDGKTLTGWKATPGGEWKVENGVIHGTSPAGDPRHGILLSEKPLGDFTTRFQFKVNKGNSGFYFRCQPVDDPVTVHGFQAELCENNDTGGLYETGGRGWVAQTDKTRVDKEKVYKAGLWNDMWVSAHGNRLVVHVNGKKTANFVDTQQTRSQGNFGLQLHGSQEMDVEFRNLAVLAPAD